MRWAAAARVVGKHAEGVVRENRTWPVRQMIPVEHGNGAAAGSPQEAEQRLTVAVSQPNGEVVTLLVGQDIDRRDIADAPRQM